MCLLLSELELRDGIRMLKTVAKANAVTMPGHFVWDSFEEPFSCECLVSLNEFGCFKQSFQVSYHFLFTFWTNFCRCLWGTREHTTIIKSCTAHLVLVPTSKPQYFYIDFLRELRTIASPAYWICFFFNNETAYTETMNSRHRLLFGWPPFPSIVLFTSLLAQRWRISAALRTVFQLFWMFLSVFRRYHNLLLFAILLYWIKYKC